MYKFVYSLWTHHKCTLLHSTNTNPPLNSYMEPGVIAPITGQDGVNATINIRSTIQSTPDTVIYYAKFQIVDQVCTKPTITIYFEDTDFGVAGDHFLDVHANDVFMGSCGSNNGLCGDYKYCCLDATLLDGSLSAGEQELIRLEKGKDSGIPSGGN